MRTSWITYCFVCIVAAIGGLVSFSVHAQISVGGGLDWKTDFAAPLLLDENNNNAYTLDIDQNKTFLQNLRAIFFPGQDGELWSFIRNIAVGILFLLLVWAGFRFLFYAPDNEEELKSAKLNLLYILLGAVIFFAGTRLLGEAGLDLENLEGVVSDGTGENSIMQNLENNVLVTVLTFLKGAAFFVALIFLVYYGYRMMSAFDEEEKLKAARTGILNVFLALVLIKIIDYVFYIAQISDFKNKAVELIVEVSKFLGYLGGIMFVIAVMYVGFLMLTAKGDDDNIDKAKNMIKTIFTIILIILLFMLVVYQVFNDIL